MPSPTLAPITTDMLKKAFETGHDGCSETGCIHEKALDPLFEEIAAKMVALSLEFMRDGLNPAMGIFCFALHIGYRLAQLQQEAVVPIEVVN